MDDDEMNRRMIEGIELLTAYFTRDTDSGALDEGLFRAVLGQTITDDDLIRGLIEMVQVSELLLWMHTRDGRPTPLETLRELAAHHKQGE